MNLNRHLSAAVPNPLTPAEMAALESEWEQLDRQLEHLADEEAGELLERVDEIEFLLGADWVLHRR